MKTKTKVPVPERKWIILILSVILLFVVIFWVKSYRKDSPSPSSSNYNSGKKGKSKPEKSTSFYSTSGKEVAIMDKPVKAYLDPLKSHTRIEGPGDAKFVLESDKTVSFICNEKPGTESGHIQDWWAMPAGNYLIYPVGVTKIVFSWW